MKRIYIDFDGVIHQYTSKWIKNTVIPDPPVKGAFKFMNAVLDEGFSITIFSTRCENPAAIEAMKKWFDNHGFENTSKLKFSYEKGPALLYIDDRGFTFKGKFPSIAFLKSFTPWNKKSSKFEESIKEALILMSK